MVARTDESSPSGAWTPDMVSGGGGSAPSPSGASPGAQPVATAKSKNPYYMTPDGGTVSYNPAYPGSTLWAQQVWSPVESSHPSAGANLGNLTYGDLMTMVGSLSPQQMLAYQKMLVKGKLLSSSSLDWGHPDNSTMTAFGELFQATIRYNQGKGPAARMTWGEMLQDAAKRGQALAEAGSAAQHVPTTSTDTSVSLTGAEGAQAYLSSAMAELLGRAPTNDEISKFQNRLNAREQANPSTRTTTNDGYGNTSSTTQASSVDPYQSAKNYTGGEQFQTEGGAYAINKYATALEQLLGGG